MTRTATLGGWIVVAAVIGLGLLLRPRPGAREELPAATSIPPAARQVMRSKMAHHDEQMRVLLSRIVLLDNDGIARAAGAIFDEPGLARPIAGDELNGLLPEQFFVLQDELKARARRLVIASQQRDRGVIASEFAALAKSCVSCHQVFLHGERTAVTKVERRP